MAKTKRSRTVPAGGKCRTAKKPVAVPHAKPAAVPFVTATSAAKVPLEQIRERIDSVDSQLHALINERAKLAQLVGV